MTTTYVRLTDTDKPESQTAITASFVDETGKHIDIGGGGTTDPALAAISTLDSSAELTDVINKVNEILNAVKNAQ